MDLEARSLQPSLKAMLLAKLREYKSDLNKLKKEVKKITSGNSNQTAHEELLEAGMLDSHVVCSLILEIHEGFIMIFKLFVNDFA